MLPAHSTTMQRFYLDFDDGERPATRDDEGEEFSGIDAAKHEALLALGVAAKDLSRHGSQGRVAICVRDDEGPVLEVSITFEAKLISK
jgi:hypothetical protein